MAYALLHNPAPHNTSPPFPEPPAGKGNISSPRYPQYKRGLPKLLNLSSSSVFLTIHFLPFLNNLLKIYLNKWVQTKVYEPILPHFSSNCNKNFKEILKNLSPFAIPAHAGIHPSVIAFEKKRSNL